MDHYFFLRRVFEEYQFTEQEYQQLVEDGELNPGVDEMIRIASSHGLILKERKYFVLGHSHERVLLVFEKEGIQK